MKFVYLTLILCSVALANDPKQISVQGTCDLKVSPDRGTISFTAENQSRNQKEAVNKTNKEINALKAKIEGLKLSHLELKNTGYNVYPVREYEKDRLVDKGTRATLTLEVTTSDISRLGESLVHASELNIKNVGALQTSLSEEKNKETYLKCLDIAADDAKDKAKQLAKKLDFSLGPVISVQENPVMPQPVPYPERTMMKTMNADMASTSIEAGMQKFSTTLQVSFGIK